MAAEVGFLKAKTKKELRKQVTAWVRQAKKKRMTIQLGWEPERIRETSRWI